MGLQMASIWGLQVAGGNIYQLIGALNAVFMAATALGATATHISNSKFQILNSKLNGKI